MSSNPNFVSELVQMARAFEELPIVQASLEDSRKLVSEQAETIQRLELRLIDAKNEADAAHAATRKAEVERDHAETMFLETDDKLNAMRRLFAGFTAEVNAFTKASEPEPVVEVKVGASEEDVPASPDMQQIGLEIALNYPIDAPAVDQSAADPTTANVQATPLTNDVSIVTSDAPTPDVAPLEVAPTVDPIASTTLAESATPTADVSSSVDDVGYHNEPDYQDHAAWEAWLIRMNARYGVGTWPSRYPAAAQ